MAIKKIKIGSTTYDINDARDVVIGDGVENIVSLTAAQYDALATKGPATAYIVTDRVVPVSSSGGGISDVTLGGTSVVSGDVAVLPAYPTTLPASDVSSWAKASTKPTYTASEVGALPSTTTIPSALSDLSADSTHRTVTDTEKSTWNNKQNAITISSSEPTSSQGSNGDIWIVI